MLKVFQGKYYPRSILNCALQETLSHQNIEEELIWHFEKDDEYSVRSAYHLCMSKKVNKHPGPSNVQHQRLWHLIWKILISHKVRMLLWRAAKNILPTRGNLRKKGMHLDHSCPFCNDNMEIVEHIILNFEFARQVFFSSILGLRLQTDTELLSWLELTISRKDKWALQLVCSVVYNLWRARNLLVFQSKTLSPIEVARMALNGVVDFNKWNLEVSIKNGIPVCVNNNEQGLCVVQVDLMMAL